MHGADMAGENSLTDSARLGKLAERIGAAMDAGMVVLFGSRATGTARHDSDVDIAIIDARRADSESGCRVLADAGADEPPIDSGHLASRDFTDCFASTRGLHRSVWNDGLILYSRERGIESPPPRLRDRLRVNRFDETTEMGWRKLTAAEEARRAIEKADEQRNNARAMPGTASETGYMMLMAQSLEQAIKAVLHARGQPVRPGHHLQEYAERAERLGERITDGIDHRELKLISEAGNQGRYGNWEHEGHVPRERAQAIVDIVYERCASRIAELVGDRVQSSMRGERWRPASE